MAESDIMSYNVTEDVASQQFEQTTDTTIGQSSELAMAEMSATNGTDTIIENTIESAVETVTESAESSPQDVIAEAPASSVNQVAIETNVTNTPSEEIVVDVTENITREVTDEMMAAADTTQDSMNDVAPNIAQDVASNVANMTPQELSNNTAAALSNIAPASGGNPKKPESFSEFLAKEYYILARYEQDVTNDYPAAKEYFTKAETLSEGQMVNLNRVKNYRIKDPVLKKELRDAREELSDALELYRIPENRWALAVAHSRFECWLDESEEGKEATSCKPHFREAMNRLVTSQRPARTNTGYFTDKDFEGIGFE